MESYLNNLFANKNILIINPCLKIKSENFEGNPAFSMTGVFYGINILKKNGYKVKYIDSFLEGKIKKNGDIIQMGADNAFLIDKINKLSSDYLIVNFSSCQRIDKLINEDMDELIRGIDKKNHAKLILADFLLSDFFYLPYKKEWILFKYKKIDYILPYNFKKSLISLMNDSIKKIRLDKEIKEKVMLDIKNINKKIKCDLDTGEINIEGYIDFFKECSKYGIIKGYDGLQRIFPAFTSRGYNYKSSNHPAACSNKWKNFKTGNIKKQLAFLKSKGINKIYILDKEANIKSNFFTKLIDILVKFELKADFVNGLRVDFLEESQIYKLNRITGSINMIIDSADQDFINNYILNNLNILKVEEHIRLLIGRSVRVNPVYYMGHPNESIAQINKTIDFAWKYYKKFGLMPELKYYVPFNVSLYNFFNFKSKINFDNFNGKPVRKISKRIDHRVLSDLFDSLKRSLVDNTGGKIVINFNDDYRKIKEKKTDSGLLCDKLALQISETDRQGTMQADVTGDIDFQTDIVYKILSLLKKNKFSDINLFLNKINLFNKKIITRLSKVSANIFFDDESDPNTAGNGLKDLYNAGIINFIKNKSLKKIFKRRSVNYRLTSNNYKCLAEMMDMIVKNRISNLNIVYYLPDRTSRIEYRFFLKKVSKAVRNIINNYSDRIKIKLINFPLCYIRELRNYAVNESIAVIKSINITGNSLEIKNFFDKKNNDKCRSCHNYFICPGY